MRGVRKSLFGVVVGVVIGAGWPWVRGIYAHPPSVTLAGISQTFQAVDGHYAWFCVVVYALCGAVFGLFVKSEPSRGVLAFTTLDAMWDLFASWW